MTQAIRWKRDRCCLVWMMWGMFVIDRMLPSVQASCSCVEDFRYFPEIRPEPLSDVGYCRYRPEVPCRFLWEELERSDMTVHLHECYSSSSWRCNDALAMLYRAVFLMDSDFSENGTTPQCSGLLQQTIDSTYFYCGGKTVCFDSNGTFRCLTDCSISVRGAHTHVTIS